jgi:hypothetical protein
MIRCRALALMDARGDSMRMHATHGSMFVMCAICMMYIHVMDIYETDGIYDLCIIFNIIYMM